MLFILRCYVIVVSLFRTVDVGDCPGKYHGKRAESWRKQTWSLIRAIITDPTYPTPRVQKCAANSKDVRFEQSRLDPSQPSSPRKMPRCTQLGGGLWGAATPGRIDADGRRDGTTPCEMLHFALCEPCLRRTMKSLNMTWPTRGFFTFYMPGVLLMPTPNRPAIVGLWTRPQCDGTMASIVPSSSPVPCPPSPVPPHPEPNDGCPLSWLYRPARNHGTMGRKSIARQGVSHVGGIIAPLPPPPPPPSLGPRGPSRGSLVVHVHLMPSS
ncbi:hypothetical protein B0T18DRAFT_246442 [Schizothecium vesticola]|uniref:Secreted protein n=1 Tax=Schizothecium vesticola TaxID=314040 RepID=A0AA40BQA4_9PEZI|nr:hypothetical protein B0T18DRAFT_246442 [Schizothecium vesticola]